MRRMTRATLLVVSLATAVAATAGAGNDQQQPQRDTTRAGARADSARRQQPPTRRAGAARADTANPRATARDRVGADDARCDDLCRRERMMDSLYGKDRERLPVAAAPQKKTPTKRP